MPNSIEIFENTLLKLITRQGTDSDRQNIVLSSGELGYTTDTKKLYIGDGTTVGGNLVGDVFLGSVSDVTSLAPASEGSFAFDSDNNKLYVLETNDGSSISDWLLIGGVYTAKDSSITISASNEISIGSLSAGNIDASSLESPIYLNGSSQIALSSVLSVDKIIPKTTTEVTLFSALKINDQLYNFPSSKTTGGFLQLVGTNQLGWGTVPLSSVSTNTITVNFPLTATANGVDVTGVAVNPLTANIEIGTHPSLSARNLWARYEASTNSVVENRGISSVTKNGIGNYTFQFDNPLPISRPMAMVQLYGSVWKQYDVRVVEANATECTVEVYNKLNSYYVIDHDLSLKIET